MNAWTGGQYSVYRVALAVVVAVHFARTGGGDGLAGLAATIPLALGVSDRIFAFIAAAMAAPSASPVLVALLFVHGLAPGQPYGSWEARGRPDPGGGWRMPRWHPFHWLGPGFVPPRRAASPATLFYDGDCGLCHRAVRFVLAEDPEGRAFRFAPLASPAFAAALPAGERAALPDSLVVRTPDGPVLVRTAGVREICDRLGGLWRVLALVSRALPERLLDRGYDAVARARKRIFAPPAEACPRVPPDLRRRFD